MSEIRGRQRTTNITLVSGVHYYQCDITDFPNLVKLCDSIKDEHGNPTVLINNAGIG